MLKCRIDMKQLTFKTLCNILKTPVQEAFEANTQTNLISNNNEMVFCYIAFMSCLLNVVTIVLFVSLHKIYCGRK